jgi:hypothetical protein
MQAIRILALAVASTTVAWGAPYTIEYPAGPPAAVLGAGPAPQPIIPDRPATLGDFLNTMRAVRDAKPDSERARWQGTNADIEADLIKLYNTFTIDVPEGMTPPDGAKPFGMTTPAYVPPDSLWDSWGNKQSNLSAAWNLTLGSGITLGLFDTGTYVWHPDLGNFACGNPLACANQIHGTQTASILGAVINSWGMVGSAPQAALVAYGSTPASEPTDLYQFWVDMTAQRIRPRAFNVSLANMSATADTIFQSLYKQGVLPVVAAGNTYGGPPTMPASLYYPLVVGGVTEQGNWWGGSAVGPQIDVIADASNAYTAVPPDTFWLQQNGTSYAAPIAAGTAGLVDSRDWNLGPYATAQIIKHSAKLANGQGGIDQWRGYGIVDAAAAVTASRIPVANDWGYNPTNGTYTNNEQAILIDASHEAHFDFTIPNLVGQLQQNGGRQFYRGAIVRFPIQQGSGSMSVYSWPRYCNWQMHHQELNLAPDNGQWVEIDATGCLSYPTTSFVVYKSGSGPNDMRIWTAESGAPTDIRLVPCQGCGVCSGATVTEAQMTPMTLFAALILAAGVQRLRRRLSRARP